VIESEENSTLSRSSPNVSVSFEFASSVGYWYQHIRIELRTSISTEIWGMDYWTTILPLSCIVATVW